MIIGFGLDAVEIKRFVHWHNYKKNTLERVFSPQEIAYCLEGPLKSAERFALRWATKEAFFKGVTQSIILGPLTLLQVCKAVSLEAQSNKTPKLTICWDMLNIASPDVIVHPSFTHSNTVAVAALIFEAFN